MSTARGESTISIKSERAAPSISREASATKMLTRAPRF